MKLSEVVVEGFGDKILKKLENLVKSLRIPLKDKKIAFKFGDNENENEVDEVILPLRSCQDADKVTVGEGSVELSSTNKRKVDLQRNLAQLTLVLEVVDVEDNATTPPWRPQACQPRGEDCDPDLPGTYPRCWCLPQLGSQGSIFIGTAHFQGEL